jgi:hypothetical protein
LQHAHSTWKRPSARRMRTGACMSDEEGSDTAGLFDIAHPLLALDASAGWLCRSAVSAQP